jgi:four helix bundle protein
VNRVVKIMSLKTLFFGNFLFNYSEKNLGLKLDMFLVLNHQKLKVYSISKRIVIECYKLSDQFPQSEKYGLASQIKRAAVSIHLNIVEGSARKSEIERKRFYEIARSSLIEVDAGLDLAYELSFFRNQNIEIISELMIECFKLLSGLIASTKAF